MIAKIIKKYKYLLPVFCGVLSVCLITNQAEAATWFGGTTSFSVANTTNYTGIVRGTGWSGNPSNSLDIIQVTSSTADEVYPDLREFTYNFSTSILVSFSGNIYTDGSGVSYNDGYLNGLVYYQIPYTVSRTGRETLYTHDGIQCSVSMSQYEGSGYRTYLGSSYMPNGSGTISIGVVFDNFPTYGDVEVCNLDFVVSYKVRVNLASSSVPSDAEMITLTPGTPSIQYNYVRGSNVASANNGVAGEIYAAIENSTSVSDIVTYLNWISDSAGDINIAVSHINEQLIPQVITHLTTLINGQSVTNIHLANLVNYLYVISNTWPNYSAQVLFYLEQLVNMNSEQSSMAAEIESQYAEKESVGAELSDGMQVVKPTVSAGDFDINANIDTGTVSTLTAFWAMFPNNALIGTMFAIAIAGIAAGFFLYGKKG